MYENIFLPAIGEVVLFKTVSSAWIDATQHKRKNKENNKECREMLCNEDCLDFVIEYFHLDIDGDKVVNMFNYHLKKRLK